LPITRLSMMRPAIETSRVFSSSSSLETDINDATNSLAGAEFCKTNIKGYPKHNMIPLQHVDNGKLNKCKSKG
jgi:hypothetical protein